MDIIVGKTAGFCYGVERAVKGAREELKTKDKQVYCLGEIVHNKQVVDELKNDGLKIVNNIEEAEGKVIIRAHGVEKRVYEIANKKNIEVKDYTCPNVLKIHDIVKEYSENGYFIFLCGNKNHPENIGTISCCGNNSYIIEDETKIEEAIKSFRKLKTKNLLLISQTTYSLQKFKQISYELERKLPRDINIVIKNTICMATKIRQEETVEIAKKVDGMIIIGGKNSSNTKKLYDLAKQYTKKVIHIETVKEIEEEWQRNVKKIGIMAGASTPKELIEEVISKLENKECILNT